MIDVGVEVSAPQRHINRVSHSPGLSISRLFIECPMADLPSIVDPGAAGNHCSVKEVTYLHPKTIDNSHE